MLAQINSGAGTPQSVLGAYNVAAVSGNVAATLGAGSALFSLRWTDASKLMLIRGIAAMAIVTAAVTTGVPFDLEAVIARAFTVSDSGGTQITLTGSNQKDRTNMQTSLVGDMRIASTGALTNGTRTLDSQGIARLQGFTGTALGTRVFDTLPSPLIYLDPLQHPIVLAQNEGLVIRAPLAGPATGTFSILVQIEWMEVGAY